MFKNIIVAISLSLLQLNCYAYENNNQPVTNRSNEILVNSAITNIEPVLPIPITIEVDARKVSLGEKIFDDESLSSNGDFACRSCHYPDKGGADQKKLSLAINGKYRTRNTPSIYNVGLLSLLNWAGSHTDLGDQAEAIIKSKQGLATDWNTLISRMKQSPDYVKDFSNSYQNSITSESIKDAIAEYMRSLITPNARFDQYLRGNTNALNAEEKSGYRLFKSSGCASCHQGVNLGGNMYSPFGVFGNYVEDRGNITKADLGRYNITGNEADKYVFRVPSLRNIALTNPYLHDGSIDTLKESVIVMSRYMLGRKLSEQDADLIVKFLHTLTGEYQGEKL